MLPGAVQYSSRHISLADCLIGVVRWSTKMACAETT